MVCCSGLTCKLYESVYAKKISRASRDIYASSKEIDLADLKEGDFVFFKIESKNISHVGVYLLNNKFVHASTKKGVMINDLNEPYYKKYFYKGGRLK
jgi:murein DD-endopeptidase / murein LD-carboxypeptidase